VGIGWGRLPGIDGIAPLVCTLTNALRKDGTWEEEAAPTFSLTDRTLERGERFGFFTLGAPVPRDIRREADDHIRSAVRRSATPYAIIHILARTIRLVASRD